MNIRTASQRIELAKAGLCINCRKNPVTPNKDGAMGLRCDNCKPASNKRRPERNKPPIGEVPELQDFTETERYKLYERAVLEMVIAGPVKIREINDGLRARGIVPNGTWTCYVLDSDTIEESPTYISTYRVRTEFAKEIISSENYGRLWVERQFKADKTLPYAEAV